MEDKKTEDTAAQETEKRPVKQIIFLENGQVVWPDGTFVTIDQVEDFMQRIVYRDWENTVYKNIMADLIRQAQKRNEQAKIDAELAAAAKEAAPPEVSTGTTTPEAAPTLKVVAEAPKEEKSKEELEAEIAALQAKLNQ